MSKTKNEFEWWMYPAAALIVFFTVAGMISITNWLIPDNNDIYYEDTTEISSWEQTIEFDNALNHLRTNMNDKIIMLEKYLEIEKTLVIEEDADGYEYVSTNYQKIK